MFFPAKGLAQKGKKAKGGKKSKQRITVAFFVSADGRKVGKPIVIWRSKKPRCFRLASTSDKLAEVSYFDDSKSWMQVEIMEKVLDTLNHQMRKQGRKVILFLDNATVHPTLFIDMYSNIKIVFIPNNTTSCLQPLDAGIIQSFKTKYRKKWMRYVIARINDDLTASEIAKGIDILQAITWVADSWKEVSVETIKNCFAKCGITDQIGQDQDDLVDEEFNSLFNELVDPECDMTAEEYADFDVETCSSLPPINSDMVDWRVSSVKACVTEYLQKECGNVNEVSLDSDDDKDDGDDNDDNEVNSKVIEIGTREALEMLDRLVNLRDLTKEERNSVVAMKDKLEIITIQNRKQSRIYDFFVC